MAEASAIAALCNMPENEEVAPIPATEAQQEVAQTSDTKAEATSTAKASDELSEDALEGAAGGAASIRVGAYNMAWVVELKLSRCGRHERSRPAGFEATHLAALF